MGVSSLTNQSGTGYVMVQFFCFNSSDAGACVELKSLRSCSVHSVRYTVHFYGQVTRGYRGPPKPLAAPRRRVTNKRVLGVNIYYSLQTCGPFFKLLTLLVDGSGGGAGATGGLPCFTQLVLARLWDVADVCPHAALEWLALQVHT